MKTFLSLGRILKPVLTTVIAAFFVWRKCDFCLVALNETNGGVTRLLVVSVIKF